VGERTKELFMTSIEETPLARLEGANRLINSTVKAGSPIAGRFVYRGELAVKLGQATEREVRPPELKAEQVLACAKAGQQTLPFFACFVWSFEHLAEVRELLGDMLGADGKYFAFCSNIDLAAKYRVPLGDALFYVLPLEESTVYNELLDLVNLDKDSLKKKDAIGKLDTLFDKAAKFKANWEEISFQRGLELMGPVKDPGEGRPV
jgi:hypothetical protein